jgi:hypothetical protein
MIMCGGNIQIVKPEICSKVTEQAPGLVYLENYSCITSFQETHTIMVLKLGFQTTWYPRNSEKDWKL